MPTLTVDELARRYVAKIPAAISGSNGHNQTFTVACALVKGFDLSIDQARGILLEYNQRCEPPWSAAELEHKLQSADSTRDGEPRGWLRPQDAEDPTTIPAAKPAPPPKPSFQNDKLSKFAERWRDVADIAWLADRSELDPSRVSADDFLRALYGDGEKVVVFTDDKSQGQALWPDEKLPPTGPNGVWFLAQPTDGKTHPNPRNLKDQCNKCGRIRLKRDFGADCPLCSGSFVGIPQPSRRSEESITSWRFMVMESDEANARTWIGALVQLPLRIAAIYTSGGRSIHALVRVDKATKQEWDNFVARIKAILVTIGADPKSLTAVRLTRLPGAYREGKFRKEKKGEETQLVYEKFSAPALQKLLYLNPDPPAAPIRGLKRKRDVLADAIAFCELRTSDPAIAIERALKAKGVKIDAVEEVLRGGTLDDCIEALGALEDIKAADPGAFLKRLEWFAQSPRARSALDSLRSAPVK